MVFPLHICYTCSDDGFAVINVINVGKSRFFATNLLHFLREYINHFLFDLFFGYIK